MMTPASQAGEGSLARFPGRLPALHSPFVQRKKGYGAPGAAKQTEAGGALAKPGGGGGGGGELLYIFLFPFFCLFFFCLSFIL